MRNSYSCRVTRTGLPKWLRANSCSNGRRFEWTVSPQPSNGASCDARLVWDIDGGSSVNNLRQEANVAVVTPVEQARQYVQQQPIVGADVTSFAQGNADGSNPDNRKAWLWVAVTPLVTFFQVILSRSQQAAQTLLRDNFGGILTSDRARCIQLGRLVPATVMLGAREPREFIKISERRGVSGELGEALVQQQKKLFELWHRVRDGTLERSEFINSASQIRPSGQSAVNRSS